MTYANYFQFFVKIERYSVGCLYILYVKISWDCLH